MANRPQIETEEKLNMVIQFILTVSNRRGAIQDYFQKEWGDSENNIDRYIAKAKAELVTQREEDRATQKARAFCQIDHVIRLAFKQKDNKTALAGIKLKMDLQGLAEPVRQVIDQTVKQEKDRVDVIAKLEQIAIDRGIGLDELCRKEGIDLEKYRAGN